MPTGVAPVATPAAGDTVTLDCAAYNYFPIEPTQSGQIRVKLQNLRPGAFCSVHVAVVGGNTTIVWGSGGTPLDQTVGAGNALNLQPNEASPAAVFRFCGSSPLMTSVQLVGRLV